jgi:hypothetical protein
MARLAIREAMNDDGTDVDEVPDDDEDDAAA